MRTSWRVFLTCWIAYCAFWTPYIVREHFPAITLARSGTLNVQPFLGWIPDIFESPRDGAFINNNPGASITGAIPLFLAGPILNRVEAWNRTLPQPPLQDVDEGVFRRTVAEDRQYYFLLVVFLTVALVMAPATSATAAYLCSRLMEAGVSASAAAIAALLYGLATPVFFRAGLLNQNLLVADAGFTILLLLWDPMDRPLRAGRAAIAGLLAGYSVLCDYSGVVVVAVTFLYVGLRRGVRSGEQRPASRIKLYLAFAAGLAPLVAALWIYQGWAFGSFYRPSQHFMQPTAPTSHGYRGFDWPSPALVWANFVDPRFGLFAYCPLLLLGFAAPFVRRVRYRIPSREMIVFFTYFVLFVLFCAANQYSWLQPATGFRYLVPVVPVLTLLALQTAQALPRTLQWLLALAAFAQSLVIAAAHENDIRLALGTLWQRHFEFVWAIRLRQAGAPVSWVWSATAWLLPAVAALILWAKWPRNKRASADC
jgi:hypothetical protein